MISRIHVRSGESLNIAQHRAVAGRATITLRVLLCAGRCCRLADYAQEMCSALDFCSCQGFEMVRMQEYLAHALVTAEAHGTVHTQNGRATLNLNVPDYYVCTHTRPIIIPCPSYGMPA